jgi:hypothetical protein
VRVYNISKFTAEFGLALLYHRIRTLGRVLQVTLVLHGSLGQPLPHHKPYDPTKYETDDTMVELSLISLVIIALKLHYGYDEQG